jgi:putative DNA primase/helicase
VSAGTPSTSVDIIERARAMAAPVVADGWSIPPGTFDPPDDEPAPPEPPEGEQADRATLARCAGLEQNDTDNGARLLAHFGPEILHVREIGWHTWGGKAWLREGGDEAVTTYAQRTAKRIHAEVALLEHLPHEATLIAAAEPLRRKATKDLEQADKSAIEAADDAIGALKGRRRSLHKHATTSGNGGRISAMIAQALPHKSAGPKDLDADHMKFNCENVTLLFSKVEDTDDPGGEHPNYRLKCEALPHDRAHLITKTAPVIYDPTATCPNWLAFMERFQPNEQVRKFLQVYHGLALTGLTGQQCFIYNYGSGANGKSTFMEAVAAVFGAYADLLNAESLTGQGQRRGDQATPDFAELPGVRYLRISELPRGEDLKEALVKSLTGGEEIKARHLNKGFFKFTPCFKAAMSGNDKPKIGGLDNGIWRRVRLVPWEVTIPDEERRPMNEILAEFEAERSGILNWLLDGLDLYMREGLLTPEAVSKATADYREQMDPVGAFLADCVTREAGISVTARDLYYAFDDWCCANAIRPWQETAFGKAMEGKGYEKEMKRVRRYLDVKLDLGDIPRKPRDTRSPMAGGAYGS